MHDCMGPMGLGSALLDCYTQMRGVLSHPMNAEANSDATACSANSNSVWPPPWRLPSVEYAAVGGGLFCPSALSARFGELRIVADLTFCIASLSSNQNN